MVCSSTTDESSLLKLKKNNTLPREKIDVNEILLSIINDIGTEADTLVQLLAHPKELTSDAIWTLIIKNIKIFYNIEKIVLLDDNDEKKIINSLIG